MKQCPFPVSYTHLVKQSKGVGETAKVSIRNARRDAIDEFKKMVKSGLPEDEAKDAEDEVQKITDLSLIHIFIFFPIFAL